jgi:DNA (cytosine-5)-methyltransferase 1
LPPDLWPRGSRVRRVWETARAGGGVTALTIGSLFSGIGGLELGLERGIGNGAHTVWQVEQNEYCRAVLAKHWPDATRYEDVRHVGRSNLAPVDVLCGGFPCQDISQAGAKVGIGGTRSGLWSEYARLVRELRPRYVVVENVAALLARGFGTVLGDLAALGYDARWDCLPAAAVGQPTRRWRVFVVAYPHGRGLEGHAEWHRQHAPAFGRADVLRLDVAARRATEAASRIRGMGAGVPRGVDRIAALGNAVVPQVAEVVGRLIAARELEREVAA